MATIGTYRMLKDLDPVRLTTYADSIVDQETLQLAQLAYDAIIALDRRFASWAPDGPAYGASETGSAMLRAYFALVDAIGHVGILLDDAPDAHAPRHATSFTDWLRQIIAEDDPANGGQGILTIDDAAAQRIDDIDAYLRSPAARWAPCGTLDALNDERAELQRRIEDRRIASTRNAQH